MVLHKSRVMSNRLGRESSLKTSLPAPELAFSSFFRYTLESEKRAVSLPEKKADKAKNTTIKKALLSTDQALKAQVSVILFRVFHVLFVWGLDMVKACYMQGTMNQNPPKLLCI